MFKSQALLNEDVLLTCMPYVDLNPVRAKMLESVETFEYTSFYECIHGVTQQKNPFTYHFIKKPLFGFVGDENQHDTQEIPFLLLSYIELVDWSGRIIREDKRGVISSLRPKLLSMLNLDNDTWLSFANCFGKYYQQAARSLEVLASYVSTTEKYCITSKNQL